MGMSMAELIAKSQRSMPSKPTNGNDDKKTLPPREEGDSSLEGWSRVINKMGTQNGGNTDAIHQPDGSGGSDRPHGQPDESEQPASTNESPSIPSAPVGLRLKIAGAAAAGASSTPRNPGDNHVSQRTPIGSASDSDRADTNGAKPDAAKPGLIGLASLSLDSQRGGSLAQISNLDDRPADHVLPTAPERITEGLDEQQLAFVKSLDAMYLVFDDAELFVGTVSRIMMDLRERPYYINQFAPEDSNILMKGIRSAAGMAQVKKVEAKEKRASGGGRGAAKKVDPALVGSLQALAGFGGFDD